MRSTKIGQCSAILNSDFIALAEVKERRILWANDAMHRIFGYSPGELIGKPTRQLFIDQASYETFGREVDAALEKGCVYRVMAPQLRKDGSVGWFEFNISRQEGQPDRVVGAIVDRTDAHDLAIQLEASEMRYRSVVEDQTEIICRFLPNGTLVFVNEIYCRIFDKSPEELIGKRWYPIAHAEDVPMIEAKLREMSPENPVVTIENRVYLASGELRWMQFVNRGFFDAEGRLKETQSVGRDITDRKKIEQQLADSRTMLELALRGADLGAWDTDIASRRSRYDDRYCAMLGYRQDELDPHMDAWMHLIHPDDQQAVNDAFRVHLAGETEMLEVEYRLRHKQGHWVWVLARGKASYDDQGHPVRVSGTHQDISDRKRVKSEGTELLEKVRELLFSLDGHPKDIDSGHRTTPLKAGKMRLSGRNREILQLIAEGRSTAQMAEELGITESTAKTHRRNLMRKLGLRNKADLIRYAIKQGIVVI